MKVGLVLSGGGAKGAYQAGLVAALAEHDIEIEMISGASIGALNGALISAAGDISTAAERLDKLWDLVATKDVLGLNPELHPRYLSMLVAAGLTGVGQLGLGVLAGWAGNRADTGLVDSSPLTDILDRYLCPHALSNGIPLHVSLYPYRGRLHAITEFIKGEVIKRFDTQQSVFKYVQTLNPEEQKEVLLASAAIPVLFTPRKVGGQLFSDGGQGNYRSTQGNTPITPLLGQGLDAIIVSHLDDGSLWDANDFPDENIFEIRPSRRLAERGARDMLGFDGQSISRWKAQGKDDANQLFDRLINIAGSRAALANSTSALQARLEGCGDTLKSDSLEQTMNKLREP